MALAPLTSPPFVTFDNLPSMFRLCFSSSGNNPTICSCCSVPALPFLKIQDEPPRDPWYEELSVPNPPYGPLANGQVGHSQRFHLRGKIMSHLNSPSVPFYLLLATSMRTGSKSYGHEIDVAGSKLHVHWGCQFVIDDSPWSFAHACASASGRPEWLSGKDG
jgi:hypothetical protein